MDKDSDRERIRTVKGEEQAHDENRRIMMTGNYVERIRKEALLNFLNIFITVNLVYSVKKMLTLSLREKINFLGFSSKFYHNIIAFQRF